MCFEFCAVTYSLHKYSVKVQCNETMIKITIDRLRATCFLAHRSSWKQKTRHRVVRSSDLNLVNFSLWTALQQNCIIKTSDTLII